MLDRFPVTFEQPYPTKATEKKILTKAGLDDADFLTHLTEWSDSVRKGFYAGATDEIVSTRRLVDIANAFAIFNDKEKAITLCLARFDDETKASFMDLYEKLDADLRAGTDEGDEMSSEETADVDDSNKCPF
jgi:cobaltochelatase CobS